MEYESPGLDVPHDDEFYETIVIQGGEVGEVIKKVDWKKTPLGSFSQWPLALKHALTLINAAQIPMAIIWGKDELLFYNDYYIPLAVGRHPQILGKNIFFLELF